MKPEFDRPPRFRISVLDLCLLVAAVALVCGATAATYVVLPGLAIYLTRHARGMSKRVQILIPAVVYLPALIGLKLDCDHCRDFWIRFGGVVPGGWSIAAMKLLDRDARPEGPLAYGLAAATALAFLVSGLVLTARGGAWRWIVPPVLLTGSCLAYYAAYTIIRM